MKCLSSILFCLFLLSSLASYSQGLGPLNIDTSKIILFLTPDSGLYNSTGGQAALGDEIYEWHDIRNGFVFTNDVNNRRPNLINDGTHKYLDFTPGDFLQNDAIKDSINGLEEFTIFIVIKSDETNTDAGFLDSEDPDDQDDGIGLRYDMNGANTGRVNCLKTGLVGNNANHQVETQSNTQTTERQVLTITWKRFERLYVYINGVVSDSSNNTFTGVMSSIQKILIGKGPKDGALTQATGWNGKIGTIIFYNEKFSATTIGEITEALPVEMVSIEAKVNSDCVMIEWVTSSETNNCCFSVERSSNTNDFTEIGKVLGAGNSNEIKYYSYTDKDPLNGKNYYRIKQTDFDGNRIYFDAIVVDFKKPSEKISIYPNPAMQGNKINITGINEGDNVKIYNTNGQECDINKLSKGIYIVNINYILREKLVIQ